MLGIGERDWPASAAPPWDRVGYALLNLGRCDEAISSLHAALGPAEGRQPGYYWTTMLVHLGDAYHAAGQRGQARLAWQEALDILEDLKHTDTPQVRAGSTAWPRPPRAAYFRRPATRCAKITRWKPDKPKSIRRHRDGTGPATCRGSGITGGTSGQVVAAANHHLARHRADGSEHDLHRHRARRQDATPDQGVGKVIW
jgi:hypothetical protein